MCESGGFVDRHNSTKKEQEMRLSEIMKEKGVTNQQLADLTGISKRTIESYRAGRREPSLSAGLAIAKALDADPYLLLDDIDEQKT